MKRALQFLTLAGAIGGAVWYALKQIDQQPQPASGTWEGTRTLSAVPSDQSVRPSATEEPARAEIDLTDVSLTDIKGIGEKRAAELASIGITTVRQLAEADAADLSAKLDGRDVSDWIIQAQQLLGG